MPTGYTNIVSEGATFEEFVWRCARAFGALILMRDDPLDAPIPQSFEPSDYYEKSIQEARQRVKELEAMTSAQRTTEGERLKQQSLDERKQWLEGYRQENQSYETMIKRVNAWEPPTAEHIGLKKFMLEQLQTSIISTDYCEREMASLLVKAPGEIFADTLSAARRHLEYCKQSQQEEIDRTKSRNQWIASLAASVPAPNNK